MERFKSISAGEHHSPREDPWLERPVEIVAASSGKVAPRPPLPARYFGYGLSRWLLLLRSSLPSLQQAVQPEPESLLHQKEILKAADDD